MSNKLIEDDITLNFKVINVLRSKEQLYQNLQVLSHSVSDHLLEHFRLISNVVTEPNTTNGDDESSR